MEYKPIMALEIHVQPETDQKMFCYCSAKYFGDKPNTYTCPTCLGMPGTLPVPNLDAMVLCIKLSLALGCKINRFQKFDRKNYFYPDLPKGYQITQYHTPAGYDGILKTLYKKELISIGIERIHIEEDAGKSIHKDDETLLDYNKAGMPLIEVVTNPEIKEVKHLTAFAQEFQNSVRFLGISNADMEKGQLRFELNISLQREGETDLPKYKVEIKNIGSISVLEKVALYEINRHREILDRGETPIQETRGIRDLSGVTYSQRVKVDSVDYRLFPEPDIPPIEFSEEEIERIRGSLTELPYQKRQRYVSKLQINEEVANTLISNIENIALFEAVINDTKQGEIIGEVANCIVGDYQALKVKFNNTIKPKYLLELSELIVNKRITRSVGKDILREALESGKSPMALVKEKGLGVVVDNNEIGSIVKSILETNRKAIDDYNSGRNPNAMMFLVGQVMKEMKGQVDANAVRKLIEANIKQ